MNTRRKVWYFEGSPAAAWVSALSEEFDPRSFPPAKKSAGVPETSTIEADPGVWLVDLERDLAEFAKIAKRLAEGSRVIGLVSPEENRSGKDEKTSAGIGIFARLPRNAPSQIVRDVVAAASENIELLQGLASLKAELQRTQQEMEELHQIGTALSAEHEIDGLLELILRKAREITTADAGSLYLMEELAGGERQLRFKLTQNDSRVFPFSEFTLPLAENSMAGYVALHAVVINLADAYAIPPDRPYRFNPRFDEETGYVTRSLMTLPMKNKKGEILGVLQLINSKRDFAAMLTSRAAVDEHVQPFSERAQRLALSLASQAAVAYQNSRLYVEIETLFEGFVKAAVTAIEQRDPTTSGHSDRVSTLTTGLAETVDRVESGPFATVQFTPEQMKEIRYAALLHDFGKVGVREEVLVKAKKLYPAQLALVQQRFDYVRKELEARMTRQKLEAALERSREEALTAIDFLDEEYKRRLTELDQYFQAILQANEPTVLPEGRFDQILEIARRTFFDPRGIEHPLLHPEEVRFLSIPKGSLDPDERQHIESHVVNTFNFLTQIPWTREIQQIPLIARAHHEKLNGTGYPYQLREPEIPLPAKMMTVCDIFDALSASDRPYKKAVPIERALDILAQSVRENELDPVLFQLFVDAKIYQLTMKS